MGSCQTDPMPEPDALLERLASVGDRRERLTHVERLPRREAQVAPIDVNNLPNATGTPPTTYQPRSAPPGGYVGGTRSTTRRP